MGPRRTRIVTTVACGVLAVGVAVGAVLVLGPNGPDVGAQATGASPAPTAEMRATELPSTESPAQEPVAPTGLGAAVPPDLVDATRATGASVYVSPNGDGSGLVVDPTAHLPERVWTDIMSLSSRPFTAQDVSDMAVAAQTQNKAMQAAGLQAFYVTRAATVHGNRVVELNYRVSGLNIPDSASFGSAIAPTRDGALARADAMFAAYPEVPLIG
ncbi:hypothetical protein [Cellulosimicrobium sp. Marseille-Q4280]|uniref:hypothetical protein n=1 Tax=Cellulosimicrobium sp. Marseille-Q4280 TaxID=2937992 RepID=UPI00203C1201|nr:hypothetical protein [Cellulosimicrobium sp. Marseille-Q4280]